MFGTRKNSRTTLPTYHIYYTQRNRYLPERLMVLMYRPEHSDDDDDNNSLITTSPVTAEKRTS